MLVTALVIMAILMVAGMTTLALTDSNTARTRKDLANESALNLTEGVLYAQAFTLGKLWPGPNRASFPSLCTSAAATTGQCPSRDMLAAANSSAPNAAAFRDLLTNADVSWTARVRDNYGALASSYDPAVADGPLTGAGGTCPAPCSRDFNNDKVMWVQARATVRGKARNLVALMRMEQLSEAVPSSGLTAGAFMVTNNGNKPFVDVTGSQVITRCTPDFSLNNLAKCTNFRGGQVIPLPVQKAVGALMDAAQISRFRDRAIADGTYYTGCPPTLTGRVVFVERCLSSPNYNGQEAVPCSVPAGMSPSCINSIDVPGLLIIRCGGIRLAGSYTYIGLMYFVNGSDGSCAPGETRGTSPPTCTSNSLDANSVLDAQGGSGILGGIAADGNACVLFNSKGLQLIFDARAFSGLTSYGTVGLTQNSWRELPAGTS